MRNVKALLKIENFDASIEDFKITDTSILTSHLTDWVKFSEPDQVLYVCWKDSGVITYDEEEFRREIRQAPIFWMNDKPVYPGSTIYSLESLPAFIMAHFPDTNQIQYRKGTQLMLSSVDDFIREYVFAKKPKFYAWELNEVVHYTTTGKPVSLHVKRREDLDVYE